MAPNERSPNTLPRSLQIGWPDCQRHSPRRVAWSYSQIFRAAASQSEMAWSATSSAHQSLGALVTWIPCRVAASTSMMSTPVP